MHRNDGNCVPTVEFKTQFDGQNPAIQSEGGFSGRVLTTDYDNYLLSYACLKANEDGYCPIHNRDVELLVRERKPLTSEEIAHLIEAVRGACVEPGDFIQLPHEGGLYLYFVISHTPYTFCCHVDAKLHFYPVLGTKQSI
jgi:hypothetical protein